MRPISPGIGIISLNPEEALVLQNEPFSALQRAAVGIVIDTGPFAGLTKTIEKPSISHLGTKSVTRSKPLGGAASKKLPYAENNGGKSEIYIWEKKGMEASPGRPEPPFIQDFTGHRATLSRKIFP
ncbi:hypothetical protein HGO34_25885 [Agrobacterium vitis]|uniref:Uncharacterized protein n=1 Tax=Agrobacterium vitis TaxID=373 RepID=A0AAE5AYX4_AGRVI|nr:hypothetical protein [Agrobacterium vitis]MCF1497079.1 hypothetical protein [Allorhizobium sp. Av2]MCM2443136.1 hypothetical protein [Agrobacterium vitis]MUZ60745.1 hypothetical protein [Agrobacterium vitis]MVA68922.1 hypothetical protein [Agrobacterium vitis]MVA90052.1 hypothetical protein [Agrobacterium vitis]